MEKAGIWLRVSTGRQDEASQLPDCFAHCERNGYEVARTYTVHGESAYHGEQDPDWAKVITDVRAGVISRIVIWKVDRLDRRNLLVAVPMVNKALDAGATVEFATQQFIDLTSMQGRIAFAMFCEMAHEESRIKSDRILVKHAALRASGSYAGGKPPIGYDIAVGADGRKALKPNDHAPVIARIFEEVAAGRSFGQVCRGLQADGIPTIYGNQAWAEKVISQIIARPVYRGLVQNNGSTYMEAEPLTTPATWLAANAHVKTRASSRGHGSRGRPMNALLRPECGQCGAPLYRARNRYRCAGFGPEGNSAGRKGCGNTIDARTLDAEVWREFAEHDEPEIVETVIPGKDYAEEIAAAQLAIRDLDVLADGYDERHAALIADLRELRARPAEPERRSAYRTGRAEGEAFQAMTEAEQRDFIRLWTLTVWPQDSGDPRALAAALMGRRWTIRR